MFGSHYSVGIRAAGSHGQQLKKSENFSGLAVFFYMLWAHKWIEAAPRSTLDISATRAATQSVPGPADTSKIFNTKSHLSYLTLTMLHQGRNIHTHCVHMLTHRLKSVPEHKLHSDIKVWVAISDSPMATVSYGLTLAQVLVCWKNSTVSASMQIYAENKYVLEETSAFSLVAGAVPCLLTNTVTLAEKAACQLCECWRKKYVFLSFCCAQ